MMKRHIVLALVAILVTGALVMSCSRDPAGPDPNGATSALGDKGKPAAPEVFATGLIGPRGLKWGPDGFLYVAEAGPGGTSSTVGQCEQVPAPIGPYTGSPTGGRISKIDREGNRTTLTDQLPSSVTATGATGGVADVAFIGDRLFALLAGGGCSHGVPEVPNAVIEVQPDGSWEILADLSAWLQANPVANPEPDDFEPDGTWYSMIAVRDFLVAVEPNHGVVVRVGLDGSISRIVDVSATQGHIVPTVVAYHGSYFVGNLGTFPIVDGTEKIMKLTPNGRLMDWRLGLTTVLGLVFDQQSRMYALEMTVGAPDPTPGLGQVVQIQPNGRIATIVSGLDLPTGMTLGPDGALYISNFGFGPPQGEILRVEVGSRN